MPTIKLVFVKFNDVLKFQLNIKKPTHESRFLEIPKIKSRLLLLFHQ